MRYGVFTASGDEHPLSLSLGQDSIYWESTVENIDVLFTFSSNFSQSLFLQEEKALNEELDKGDFDDQKTKGREYYCQECAKTLWFMDNVQILKHKKEHQQQ